MVKYIPEVNDSQVNIIQEIASRTLENIEEIKVFEGLLSDFDQEMKNKLLTAANKESWTPLMIAVFYKQDGVIQKLLALNEDLVRQQITAMNNNGNTPLKIDQQQNYLDIAAKLLQAITPVTLGQQLKEVEQNYSATTAGRVYKAQLAGPPAVYTTQLVSDTKGKKPG